MANSELKYGFYNSKEDSKRVYSAIDFGRMFDGVITDGVFPSVGERFNIVKDEGLRIQVKPGRAWFNHTWNLLENAMEFTLNVGGANYGRYDAVVLHINASEVVRENSIIVKTGTESEHPVPTELENINNVYEYVIGYIYIPVGATEIDQSNISYLVGLDADPLGFYKSNEICQFAYAIGDNHLGKCLIDIPLTKTVNNEEVSIWEERVSQSDGSTYYVAKLEVNSGVISENSIVNADIWTEGDNITMIQKQENSFGYIFRYDIVREGAILYLVLYAYHKPDVAFTIRFVGKGVSGT